MVRLGLWRWFFGSWRCPAVGGWVCRRMDGDSGIGLCKGLVLLPFARSFPPPGPVLHSLPAIGATGTAMTRFFNTAGPNRVERHYTLPALARLPQVAALIEQEAWFVLHAPRQSGKTTAMRALAQELTASGNYAALWATCEMGEPFGKEPDTATRLVCDDILANARLYLPAELQPPALDPAAAKGGQLARLLHQWCLQCPRPVVLLLDEIDALRDEALISVLRQLRGIFANRPHAAPSSLALIGLRDVRDYKVASGGSSQLGTASPFNVKAAALTLGNFSRADVAALYGQHTAETGQAFLPEASDLAFELTQGQPWLVNALAYDIVMELKAGATIQASHVSRAKERLILSRATHLDSLADKLNDPRVRGVIAPVLAGDELGPEVPLRDIEYCQDLGLIVRDGKQVRIANQIYREVLPRELTIPWQLRMNVPERRWAKADGKLDLPAVLAAFVDFWHQHGEWMVKGQYWPEAAQQIVLMAFLQRLVNGGGMIEREYGLGTRRLDLLIRWHVRVDEYGAALQEDLHALECKVWRDGRPDPTVEGLKQLDAYCGRLGLTEGTLLLFDARSDNPVPWTERGQEGQLTSPEGRAVRLLTL
jgi:hypothetical protein